MKRLTLLSIGMILSLAACTSGPKTTAETTPQPAAEKPAVQTQDEKATVVGKLVTPAPVAPPAKPRILLDPDVLIGKTSQEIEAAFGQPHLLRKDAPAEVWQYLADGCALNLFFFPDGRGQELVINHVAINGREVASQNKIDSKQCFNDHLKEVGAEDRFLTNPAS